MGNVHNNDNWLYRLRHLSIRNVSTSTNDRATCNGTRHSFRRSLKKMHTRVKNAMFPSKNRRVSTYVTEPPAAVEPATPSALPSPVPNDFDEMETPERVPTDEIFSLSNRYWYWGSLTGAQAKEKLKNAPDGAFLIRDSTSASHLFSISFRSIGKTWHSRIEYSHGKYSLYGQKGFPTVTELIENAIDVSKNGIYCYSTKMESDPNYPIRFTKPISRYTQVPSLRYLCRIVIRQYTNINEIPKLPLPTVLFDYLMEGPYF